MNVLTVDNEFYRLTDEQYEDRLNKFCCHAYNDVNEFYLKNVHKFKGKKGSAQKFFEKLLIKEQWYLELTEDFDREYLKKNNIKPEEDDDLPF